MSFATDKNTRLIVGTTLIAPKAKLEIGSETSPIAADKKAELIIAARDLATSSPDPATGVLDPEQFGTSLLVLGDIEIYGSKKTLNMSRLSNDIHAGDSQIILQDSLINTGIQVGDTVLLPDTRQFPLDFVSRLFKYVNQGRISSHSELVEIAAISDKVITLKQAAQFNHKGPKNPDGTLIRNFDNEILSPYVAFPTKNVLIKSESTKAKLRGHVLIAGNGNVDIKYASFVDLGRTKSGKYDNTQLDSAGNVIHLGANQQARYWVHFHHFIGPRRHGLNSAMSNNEIKNYLETNGYQYEFVGNTISSSDPSKSHKSRWGLVVHGSSFGKVSGNILFDMFGSGIFTEDGSESYNTISHNFVAKVTGDTSSRRVNNKAQIEGNFSLSGSCIWLRAPFNWVEDNVVADCLSDGYAIDGYYRVNKKYLNTDHRKSRSFDIPLFPGADLHNHNETRLVEFFETLSFKNNESMGATPIGLYGAWASGLSADPSKWQKVTIDKFTSWNAYARSIYWYHSGEIEFKNTILLSDYDVMKNVRHQAENVGFNLGTYENVSLSIKDSIVKGFAYGIWLPTNMTSGKTIEVDQPSYLKNIELENFINLFASSPVHKREFLFEDLKFKNLDYSGSHLRLKAHDGRTLEKTNLLMLNTKRGSYGNFAKTLDPQYFTTIHFKNFNQEQNNNLNFSFSSNPHLTSCIKDPLRKIIGPSCNSFDFDNVDTSISTNYISDKNIVRDPENIPNADGSLPNNPIDPPSDPDPDPPKDPNPPNPDPPDPHKDCQDHIAALQAQLTAKDNEVKDLRNTVKSTIGKITDLMLELGKIKQLFEGL